MVVPRFGKLRILLTLSAGSLVLVGLALAFAPSPRVATTVYPQETSTSSPSPSHSSSPTISPSPSPASSSRPVVAGASTVAPKITSKNNQAQPAQPAQEPYQPHISLVLDVGGKTSTYLVRLVSGANPCTVLEEARQEGWISSETIDYTTQQSSLHSIWVTEINGISGWTYTVKNGSPPGGNLEGCTYPGSIQPIDGSTVTWKH